mgnify:CR=1 FL=1
MQLSLSRRNTMEKNWEDDITDLDDKIKAAQDKLINRKLNSHTDILTRFVVPPEENKESES